MVCQMGDIAVRLKRKLRWDPVKEEFIDDLQANRMLSRPRRSPWSV
jgi:Oxidoreductase family, C-terminal alpha/beta domain